MKRLVMSILAVMAICVSSVAETWTDVTRFFIQNPNFTSYNGWGIYSGYSSSSASLSNRTLSIRTYDYAYVYLPIQNLPAGEYRVSFKAFCCNGTAAEDYTLYSKGQSQKLAFFQVYTSYNDKTMDYAPIHSLASGAVEQSLGGTATKVGGSFYVPQNGAAARAWFDAGYYENSYTFKMEETGYMYISLEKSSSSKNAWLCVSDWRLEYKGELTKVKEIELNEKELNLVEKETVSLYANVSPSNATIKNVTWQSSNPTVAMVDNYGEVTALSKGTAVISAKAIDGSGVVGKCEVIVKDPDVATSENVVINEIMVANLDQYLDKSWNYGGWVELYNPTHQRVDVSKLYVTDDENDLKKCKVNITSPILNSKKYVTLYFDHYDAVFSPYNISFKLKYEGGTLYVTDGNKILSSVEYPQAISRCSYGRVTDGSDTWGWFDRGTPNSSNAGPLSVVADGKQVEAPVIEEKGGFYTGTMTVHVKCPEGAILRYTLDGSVPNSRSLSHEGDLTITDTRKSITLRVKAEKAGMLPSEVVTRNFIYKNKNYVFPVIALSTDWNNIESDSYGIFVPGYGNGRPGNSGSYGIYNWNADWDRPVNFEYFTEDGECVVNQMVDMSACGGWSRAYNPHSFKLKANKYYLGQNSLDYQFFDEKPGLKHKVLQVRNGGNDNTFRIKDAAYQMVIRSSGLNVNTQAWQPAHVFINGSYYNVLNIREPNNKHFAYSNYGYDTDEVDQFEMSPDSGYVQKEGTDEKFLEWYELSANAADSATYSKICDIVDIDQYINYMAVELYLRSNDWPQNNIKGFRSRNDGKFHFVIFDLDQHADIGINPFNTFAAKKKYTFNPLQGTENTPWKTGQTITAEIKFVTIFLNMLKNDSFRRQFIDSYCIVNGSVFTPSRVSSVVTPMRDYMNKGMTLNGGSCTESANSVIANFTSDRQTTMMNYLKSYEPMGLKKTSATFATISTDTPESELYINNVKIPTGVLSGNVYAPVTLRTSAPAGYKFKGWSRFSTTEIISTEPEVELSGVTARYVAHWEKMTDEEMMEHGVNPSPVVINEVSAANNIYINDYYKKSDWIELYNTTGEDINIAGLRLSDKLSNPELSVVPADNPMLNTIIPAHGYKVIWCDKKESVSDALHANFKLDADAGVVMISKVDDAGEMEYADTLVYTAHGDTESFGRFPDGGAQGYVMQKPSLGAKNIFYSDAIGFIGSHPIVTGIENVVVEKNSGIIIAYVGNGVVNVKSDECELRRVDVYSASGALVSNSEVNGQFATVSLSGVTGGMYVVRATDVQGNSVSVKISVRR